MRRIGLHVSIAGGIHRSIERASLAGCNTMQIFSHNPRGWRLSERDPEELRAFSENRKKYGISPVFIHASYLINLASADVTLKKRSLDMVVNELNIADCLGAEYVVLHTGSASGEDPVTARARATKCLIEIAGAGRWKTGLLLENTAGEKGDITSKTEDLSGIIDKVPDGLISGICIDTCHAFSAGYDLRGDGLYLLLGEIEEYIGFENVRLLHLNDSKGGLGSGIDRHENIGQGKIGLEGFKRLLNQPVLSDIPVILETPRKLEDDDQRNLKIVRNLINQ